MPSAGEYASIRRLRSDASSSWFVLIHSIVGAIVGFGSVGLGVDAVAWGKVAQIVLSWLTSPLIGGVLAYLIFSLIRTTILDRENPIDELGKVGPFFFFYVFFIIGLNLIRRAFQ